jgi:hypothetical protein
VWCGADLVFRSLTELRKPCRRARKFDMPACIPSPVLNSRERESSFGGILSIECGSPGQGSQSFKHVRQVSGSTNGVECAIMPLLKGLVHYSLASLGELRRRAVISCFLQSVRETKIGGLLHSLLFTLQLPCYFRSRFIRSYRASSSESISSVFLLSKSILYVNPSFLTASSSTSWTPTI